MNKDDAWNPHVFTCVECNNQIDDRLATVWTGVAGWEKKRDQGGTNHIALRKSTGKAMCNACMIKLQAGVNALQGSLL